MKTLRLVAAAVTVVAALSGLATADETPWCDMTNCAMCKSIVEQPGLMDNMSMEVHDISDGIVQVCAVMPAHLDAYKAAWAQMDATSKKLQAGEKMNLCGMCQAYGGLMVSGAKVEMVATKFGHVQMMRGTAPEMITQIHGWAERTRTEMAKMAEAQTAVDLK